MIAHSEVAPLVLHSSWRGRVTAFGASTGLAALGAYGVAVGGIQVLNTIVLVLGLGLLAVVLWDFPLHTTLGPDGIERRCLVRTERLDWAKIRTVGRPGRSADFAGGRQGLGRPSQRSASSGVPEGTAEGLRTSSTKSGLVAEINRRRYMLCDRIESSAEYDELKSALKVWAPNAVFRASRPPDGSAPTWLYKRRLGSDKTGLIDRL